jgi:cytidine deaminase
VSAIEKIVFKITINQLCAESRPASIFKLVSNETPGKHTNVIINTYNNANNSPCVFAKLLYADFKKTLNDSFFGGFAIEIYS